EEEDVVARRDDAPRSEPSPELEQGIAGHSNGSADGVELVLLVDRVRPLGAGERMLEPLAVRRRSPRQRLARLAYQLGSARGEGFLMRRGVVAAPQLIAQGRKGDLRRLLEGGLRQVVAEPAHAELPLVRFEGGGELRVDRSQLCRG